jgi:SAM-dependent methyltransferase
MGWAHRLPPSPRVPLFCLRLGQPSAPWSPLLSCGFCDRSAPFLKKSNSFVSLTMEAGEWDSVGHLWPIRRYQLWREFTDRLQLSLFRSWIPLPVAAGEAMALSGDPFFLLKTDLFDEVAHHGLVPSLLQAGIRVFGIDLSPFIVTEALARNPGLEGRIADVRTMPLASSGFDAVFSGSTLDHLSTEAEINTALDEIARVLRQGGHLVITMDNPVNPIIRLRNGPLLGLLRQLGIVPYQVGMTLGPRALVEALQGAGFIILETKSLLHCPRWLCVLLAWPIGYFTPYWREVFLRFLGSWEALDRLPTRWWSGYYVAIHAIKG